MAEADSTPRVYVLHGILVPGVQMRALTSYLNRHGFDAVTLHYPSTRHTWSVLADMIWQQICDDVAQRQQVHFVGFSMGGQLIRVMLERYRPQNVGRVVLLASPNKGSEVADMMQHWWLYKRLFGPAGQQLITQSEECDRLRGVPYYEVGCLAGTHTIDPFCYSVISGPNDGKVSVESAQCEGMTDFKMLPVSHTFFPLSRRVMAETQHFLQEGRFRP